MSGIYRRPVRRKAKPRGVFGAAAVAAGQQLRRPAPLVGQQVAINRARRVAIMGAQPQVGNAAWPRPRRLQGFGRFFTAPYRPAAFGRERFNSAWPFPQSGRYARLFEQPRAHPRIRVTGDSFEKKFNSAWPQPKSGKFERLYRQVRVHPKRLPIYSAFQRKLPTFVVPRRQIFERFFRVNWEQFKAAQWHLRGIGALKTTAPEPPTAPPWQTLRLGPEAVTHRLQVENVRLYLKPENQTMRRRRDA